MGIFHLLANGEAGGMILFGSLTVLALLGPLGIDAKRRASMRADWEQFVAETSYIPLQAIVEGPK